MAAGENERAMATDPDWAKQIPATPFADACTLVFDGTPKGLVMRGLNALK
jgi:hypothetical protein